MILHRRGFLFGLGAFAIVRPEIIMPIKAIVMPVDTSPVFLSNTELWNLAVDRSIKETLRMGGMAYPTPASWYEVNRLLKGMKNSKEKEHG